jgi:hypothetical protein
LSVLQALGSRVGVAIEESMQHSRSAAPAIEGSALAASAGSD